MPLVRLAQGAFATRELPVVMLDTLAVDMPDRERIPATITVITHSAQNFQMAFQSRAEVSLRGSGAVLARYEYAPFGEPLRKNGPAASINPLRFSTKRENDSTGLSLYERRAYRADVGWWITRDPVEEDAGPNLYQFVGNDPVSNVDPFGQDMIVVGSRPVNITLGIANHMTIEYWQGGECIPYGFLFHAACADSIGSRAELRQLIGTGIFSACYAHYIWVRPRQGAPLERRLDNDRVSYITEQQEPGRRFVVIYSDYDEPRREAWWMWWVIRGDAGDYPYAEHLPLSYHPLNWADSMYQFPWENPGNNSNTFVREMARGIGRNANLIEVYGSHPGANVARPVQRPDHEIPFLLDDCNVR